MDGHRGYPDDSQPSWYTGGSGRSYDPDDRAPGMSPYDSGVYERPSGAFRLPEQRATETAYQPPAPYLPPEPVMPAGETTHDQVRVPVRGPEYPTIRPTGATSLADAPPSQAMSPAVGGLPMEEPDYPAPAAQRVRRVRRPLLPLVVAAVTGVLLIPALVLLFRATFLDPVTAGGVVPAVLLTLGLLLAAFGLFALAGESPATVQDWARPPVVYLPVGVVLLVIAGLAVG